MAVRDVEAAALAAWRVSDNGGSFVASLAEHGLMLVQGDDVPVLVDRTGNIHPLAPRLGKASKETGARISAAAVRERLAGVELPLRREKPVTTLAASSVPDDQQQKGHVHDDASKPAKEIQGAVPSAGSDPGRPDSTPPYLDGQPDRRTYIGHDDGPADTTDARVHGQQRNERAGVCGAPGLEADRRPDGALGTPRAAGAGGADAARPGGRPAGADCGEPNPDRAAIGRRRVQARRDTRTLATAVGRRGHRLAELTAALREVPTPESLLSEALAASDRHAEAILSAGPWQDPASRDVALIARHLHDDARDQQQEREILAEQTFKAFEVAKRRVRFLDRLLGLLGVTTTAVRALDEAETLAIRADLDRVTGHNRLREVYRETTVAAQVTVDNRVAERQQWENRQETVAARREASGNDFVRNAIAGGDKRLAVLATQNLVAAREFLFRHEAEQSRQAIQVRLYQEQFRRRMEEKRSRVEAYKVDTSFRSVGWR